jgi:NADH:ubiquinone oxidoreductase subunit 4 (subunit M)
MVLNNYIIECFLSLIPSFLPIIILISRNNRRSLTFIALLVSCLVFIASILLIVQLVPAINTYQLYGIIDSSQRWFFPLYAVDNLGSLFLVLTTFIMPFSILYLSNSIYILYKEYILLLLIIEFFLINLFLITDLFWFYIMFESLLFPFFILIGAFGYRRRRNHAAYQFLFYTIFGSIFFLAGTIYLYSKVGCTDFRLLTEISLYWPHQLILWFLFFLALFIKVPVMPAHIWLPEAHVEAPTVGSVILASLILKISFYGFLRMLLPIFPNICIFM